MNILSKISSGKDKGIKTAIAISSSVSGITTFKGMLLSEIGGTVGWEPVAIAAGAALALSCIQYTFWTSSIEVIANYTSKKAVILSGLLTCTALPLVVGASIWMNVVFFAGHTSQEIHVNETIAVMEDAGQAEYEISQTAFNIQPDLKSASKFFADKAKDERLGIGDTGIAKAGTISHILDSVASSYTKIEQAVENQSIKLAPLTQKYQYEVQKMREINAVLTLTSSEKMAKIAPHYDTAKLILADMRVNNPAAFLDRELANLPDIVDGRALDARTEEGQLKQRQSKEDIRGDLQKRYQRLTQGFSDQIKNQRKLPSLERLKPAMTVWRYKSRLVLNAIFGAIIDVWQFFLFGYVLISVLCESRYQRELRAILERTKEDEIRGALAKSLGQFATLDPSLNKDAVSLVVGKPLDGDKS